MNSIVKYFIFIRHLLTNTEQPVDIENEKHRGNFEKIREETFRLVVGTFEDDQHSSRINSGDKKVVYIFKKNVVLLIIKFNHIFRNVN